MPATDAYVQHLLLIDDDPASNYLARLLIEEISPDTQVYVSRNGQQAIDFLDNCIVSGNCPELVLLDLNMPLMNGFELLEVLQTRRAAPKRIYILTASQHGPDAEQAAQYRVAGFLMKPLAEDQLREIMRLEEGM